MREAGISEEPTMCSRDIMHISDQKVLKMVSGGGWSLLSEAKSFKLDKGTIRLEST
jgi:hypothetical protein